MNWVFKAALSLTMTMLFSTAGASNRCGQLLTSPQTQGVSTATVYSDPGVVITQYLPARSEGSSYLNFNAKKYNERLPDVFIAGDGTLNLPFVRIDQRPGSPLSRQLSHFESLARAEFGSRPDAILKWVHQKLLEQLGPIENVSAHPLYVRENTSAELQTAFASAGRLLPGHEPIKTSVRHPVVNLEAFIHARQSYCFQKAIIGSLLLSRAGIEHKIIAANLQTGMETVGHTVLQLKDGRILDPTLQVLSKQTTEGALPGWVQYGNGLFLFKDQAHYYLVPPQ